MTDRIRADFERWATGREFPDLTQSMGRYNRAVVRWMWESWKEQAERVTDMAAALERAHNRQTGLLKQIREHDTRRAAAVAQAASLADEVERLNNIISRLSVEGQDAVEM
jgi:predicted DsbA family dithiol-disulfide isomerase